MPEDIYYKVLAARLSLVLITLRQLEPVNQGLREEQLLGGISLRWVLRVYAQDPDMVIIDEGVEQQRLMFGWTKLLEVTFVFIA